MWFYRIQCIDSKLAAQIYKNKCGIDQYHMFASNLDHSAIWPKSVRILPPATAAWFVKTEFYKQLAEEFDIISISDEDNMGWPNLYWRLVRPNKPDDIGPLHRDSWFWKLNDNFPKPMAKHHRVKVWIPIVTEPGKNGLMVEEASHTRDDIEWSGEPRHGINKPVLLTELNLLHPILLELSEGNSIIFHDDLVHGGSLNRGKCTRVSLEFTLLVKEA